jgi:hypothetical protein
MLVFVSIQNYLLFQKFEKYLVVCSVMKRSVPWHGHILNLLDYLLCLIIRILSSLAIRCVNVCIVEFLFP